MFRALMHRNDLGMASAAGFYQSVVGFVLVLAPTSCAQSEQRK